MKTLLIILVMIPLLFTSCKKGSNEKSFKDVGVGISYKNAEGMDLLDPSTPNYFSANNIHVYHLIKGVKTEVNNPMMDYPHDFRIIKNDSLEQYELCVFLSPDTVLVQLNKDITDTITCTIDANKSIGYEAVKKIWYNGTQKWEFGKVAATFTIIK